MAKTSKGISVIIFLTSLILNISFIFLWIYEAQLFSYKYLLECSLWGWLIANSLLVSSLASFYKYGNLISIILLYLYSFFLIANLMYCNYFNTQISLWTYRLCFNLFSFMDSVVDVFQVKFLLLIGIVTIGCLSLFIFKDCTLFIPRWAILSSFFAILIITFNIPHSFLRTYNQLRLTHQENAATTILYSPFTNLIFQYIEASKTEIVYSETTIKDIIDSNLSDLKRRNNNHRYNAFVLIIVESLESFVIGLSVDSIQITPNLSALASNDNVLFVPMIIPEVGIARSMDAQLILNCGLLPPSGEAFCYTYPSNTYPSIAKQLSDRQQINISYSINSDMSSIYNQSVISKAFGYSNLITRDCFITEPKTSIHVDDSVFFAQVQRMLDKYIWPSHQPAVIQLVTYSMHQPFKLPVSATKTSFNELHPKLGKYLNVVKYTDKALGDFINYLQNRDDFSSTLIAITGDHNVFSKLKYEEYGITELTNYKTPYVPLLILNSTETGMIDFQIYQTSIYPTLLELLGMTENVWPGIRKSIFHRDTLSVYNPQAFSNYLIHRNYWGL